MSSAARRQHTFVCRTCHQSIRISTDGRAWLDQQGNTLCRTGVPHAPRTPAPGEMTAGAGIRIALTVAIGGLGVLAVAVVLIFRFVFLPPVQTAASAGAPSTATQPTTGPSPAGAPPAPGAPAPSASPSFSAPAGPLGAPVPCTAGRPWPTCFDDRVVNSHNLMTYFKEKKAREFGWRCYRHGDKVPQEDEKQREVGSCAVAHYYPERKFNWRQEVTWTNLSNDPQRKLDEIEAFAAVHKGVKTDREVTDADAIMVADAAVGTALKAAFGSHREIADQLLEDYKSTCRENGDGHPVKTSTGYTITCDKPFVLDVGKLHQISVSVSFSSYP